MKRREYQLTNDRSLLSPYNNERQHPPFVYNSSIRQIENEETTPPNPVATPFAPPDGADWIGAAAFAFEVVAADVVSDAGVPRTRVVEAEFTLAVGVGTVEAVVREYMFPVSPLIWVKSPVRRLPFNSSPWKKVVFRSTQYSTCWEDTQVSVLVPSQDS